MSFNILICLFSFLLPSWRSCWRQWGFSSYTPWGSQALTVPPHPTVGDVSTPVVQPHPLLLPQARVLLVKFCVHCSQTFFSPLLRHAGIPPEEGWTSAISLSSMGICSGQHSRFFPQLWQVHCSVASTAPTEVCWPITGWTGRHDSSLG